MYVKKINITTTPTDQLKAGEATEIIFEAKYMPSNNP